jgi:enamine deaminase RidA (YjgF/YER057c/UK114 family)
VAAPDDRLTELGITLPEPTYPHPPLDAVAIWGDVAWVSGQLPRLDGQVTCLGTVGADVTVDEAVEAARVSALNALAILRAELPGGLGDIARVLSVTGYVACVPGFSEQPKVIDGFSKVLYDVFGDAGRHTRCALGVAALPRGSAVEVELTVALTKPVPRAAD